MDKLEHVTIISDVTSHYTYIQSFLVYIYSFNVCFFKEDFCIYKLLNITFLL